MIKIQNVSKSFGEVKVLTDVSLTISSGEVCAIIGPSGSGKSTLLWCLNLLEKPDSGIIYIQDQEVTSENVNILQIRQNIGMVFQHFHLFPHMTVLQNMIYAPVKVKNIPKKVANSKAFELLERVDLADKADTYPSRLSGGQQQRVAIARSLAMKPAILLFDEPTSALDPEMVKEVLEVIRSLAHTGITMVIVTHEMGFAREAADRICFLDKGKLTENLPPSEFFSNPRTQRARQFLEKML
ncbi:amino acid ABC transporter ATP-binding protein [Shimazuella kribbensis]|uniref:amino acid ABC transporter ATP-binding protein n=1 Tax=Shimazuella kribbensis TaxID=139808 RepID=UPI000414A06E|nr:amino acid ABC transporter ATP-binding protein [Shimazuella kribbensis]